MGNRLTEKIWPWLCQSWANTRCGYSDLYEKNKQMPFGLKTLIVFYLIAFLVALGLLLVKDPGNVTNWLRLFGFSFVFATFTYSMEAARRRAIKAHTMDVLMSTREGSYFQDMLDTFSEYKRKNKGKRITWDEYMRLKEHKQQRFRNYGNVILYLVNYYEYLAAGIDNGDLDEAVLKNTLRGQFCGFVRVTQRVIKHYNDDEPRALIYMINLYREWEDRDKYEKTVFQGSPQKTE